MGVAAPLVVDAAGEPEDSARRFPSAWRLAAKLLGLAPRLDYAIGSEPFSPDWVAGMFLAFRREAFAAVDGFDERYFLYYEDVDLCRRLRASGFDVRLVPGGVRDASRAPREPSQLSPFALARSERHALSALALAASRGGSCQRAVCAAPSSLNLAAIARAATSLPKAFQCVSSGV